VHDGRIGLTPDLKHFTARKNRMSTRAPRILVAEDDANIRNGLVDTLEGEGYVVTGVRNGREALEHFSHNAYELIILDIMMPEVSGYDVCRQMRQRNEGIPILMLTAKSEEVDTVIGLKLGADDYVTKPFGIRELLARVEALLRRAALRRAAAPGAGGVTALPPRFEFGPAEIDSTSFRVKLGKDVHDLSLREMQLIEYFYDRPGQVLTREDLLADIWGVEYTGTTRTLDQHIAQLRKKIERDPRNPLTITTVHGVGYRYEADEA
jgi:DNA-binding response OmpR family regulator